MDDRWQMISHNGGVFKPMTVELSTVRMPNVPGLDLGYSYETCVFTNVDSEVVERYHTVAEATQGHAKWCRKLGLTV